MPASVQRSGNGNNFVFRFELQGIRYFLKFAPKDKGGLLEYEANAIKQLHRWGLPAPEIHTAEDLDEQVGSLPSGGQWMLLRDGGESLTLHLADHPELMVEAGRLVKRYHAREFGRYGKIVAGKVIAHDMHAERWIPLCNRLMRLTDQGLFDRPISHAAYNLISDFQPSGQAVLCHGELTLPHLLVEAGEVAVPIDWSYMASLPATYDLASLEIYCDLKGFDFCAFLQGYGLKREVLLADPDRLGFRLAHIVRQLGKLNSKSFGGLKRLLASTVSDAV